MTRGTILITKMIVISIVLSNRDVASYFEMEGPDRKLQGQMASSFIFRYIYIRKMYIGNKKEPLLYLPMLHSCQRWFVGVPTCNPIALYHSPAVEMSYRSPNMPKGFWGESTPNAVSVRLLNCFWYPCCCYIVPVWEIIFFNNKWRPISTY